jgi:pimeloyl-ACP methyl ester carboxylesterase
MRDDAPLTSDPEPRPVPTAVGTVAVAEEGPPDAPAVLCVHGIPGSSRDFRYLGPVLAPAFRVLRVEMPGFGRSPASDIHTVSGWARVVSALRDALALDRPLLLAHSFGGGSCLVAAGADPTAWRGLVLVASMGVSLHREMRWPAWVYRLLATGLRFLPTRPLFLAGGRSAYRRSGFQVPSSWRELLLHVDLLASVDFPRLGAAARAATLPALAVSSLDDRICEPAIQRELAATLPDCTPLVFPTGGHHLQKHRAREIARAMTERFAG